MSDAPLVLFDDAVADGWAPFALTRPIGEVRFGRWTLRERVERATGRRAAGHITRPWLASYSEPDAPGVVVPHDAAGDAEPTDGASARGLPRGGTYWCARAVPEGPVALPPGGANLRIEGRLAAVALPAGADPPAADWFGDPDPRPDLPELEVEGTWLDAPWDLVACGPERLARDLAGESPGPSETPEGCWRVGSGALRIAPGGRVEPGVLFDTREGDISLDEGVEVRTGARLAGPLYAGPGSRLYGGSYEILSAGPRSYLRGEIEEVTVFGYTNKAHDGFLGHAVLGRWVNLGALTTNSDLKNNYGTIRVGPSHAVVDTGLRKLGCLIGDHVKTGIGVLLNTGAILGAGSNIWGPELPPKWVEPFSWGRGDELGVYRRDAFLETAARVVERRGVEADAAFRRWLDAVWTVARGDG